MANRCEISSRENDRTSESHANNHLITGVPNDDFNAEVASPDGTRGFFGHGDKKKQERYLEQRGNASDFELLLKIFFAEEGMASETLRRPLRGGRLNAMVIHEHT